MRFMAIGFFNLAILLPKTVLALTLTIGLAGPFSGKHADEGKQMWQGVRQAVKDINVKGGLNGVMLSFVKMDDECDPLKAKLVAEHMVNKEHISVVIGHFCSEATLAALPVYTGAGVLMMIPASSKSVITEKGYKNIFRTCGRDDRQIDIISEFLINTLHVNRIAIVYDQMYGQSLADTMKDKLTEFKQEPILFESVSADSDVGELVSKLYSDNVDAIYYAGLPAQAGGFIRQVRERNLNIPFVSGSDLLAADFVLSAGGSDRLKNVYMAFDKDPIDFEISTASIKKTLGQNHANEIYMLYSYAAVQAIAKAIEETDSIDIKQLANWLHQNPVETVLGQQSWDEKGDIKTLGFLMYEWP